MLTKFSVSNFKGFNQGFDFSDTNGYEFNKSCVKNGIVNNALIYGHNGVGKSNLGFAIFDIIGHLTDKKTIDLEYAVYLNALNPADYATFRFEFLIEGHKIVYEYRKKTHKEILSEYFEINGKILAVIDRNISNEATFYFEGAESLRNTVENVELSILKYVKNNSVLEPTDENLAFLAFFKFVETMLFLGRSW
jgi:AAA15 family ATPase/GTPase